MKYELEIDVFLRELLFDDWMSETDYSEVLESTFKIMGITKQKLSDDIEIGVKNGYTVEQQFEIVKRLVK